MATRRGFLQGVAAGSVLIGCRGKEDTGTTISAGLRRGTKFLFYRRI